MLAEEAAASLAGAHAVALHACGDLHRHLIDHAGPAGARALDVAPCCYPLGADDHYRPRGGASALHLDRNALRLAVTETVTASPRLAARSERLSAWKLAFVTLREAHAPGAPYRTFKPVPAAWGNRDFAFFLQSLAARGTFCSTRGSTAPLPKPRVGPVIVLPADCSCRASPAAVRSKCGC